MVRWWHTVCVTPREQHPGGCKATTVSINRGWKLCSCFLLFSLVFPPTHHVTAVAPCPAALAGSPHSHPWQSATATTTSTSSTALPGWFVVVVLYWVFSWLCWRDFFAEVSPPLPTEDPCSCLSWRDPAECHLRILHLVPCSSTAADSSPA